MRIPVSVEVLLIRLAATIEVHDESAHRKQELHQTVHVARGPKIISPRGTDSARCILGTGRIHRLGQSTLPLETLLVLTKPVKAIRITPTITTTTLVVLLFDGVTVVDRIDGLAWSLEDAAPVEVPKGFLLTAFREFVRISHKVCERAATTVCAPKTTGSAAPPVSSQSSV